MACGYRAAAAADGIALCRRRTPGKSARRLSFENVRMFRAEHEGVGVLVVEGSIVNVTKRPVKVPQLRLAMHNDAKHEI